MPFPRACVWLTPLLLGGCLIVPTWERPDPECGAIVKGGGTLPAGTDLRFVLTKFSKLRVGQSTRHDVEASLGEPEAADADHRVIVYGQMMSQNDQINLLTWAFGPTRCRTCYLLMQFDEANVLARSALRYDDWHEGVSDWTMRDAYAVPDGMIESFVASR